jgi:hypothetical protein
MTINWTKVEDGFEGFVDGRTEPLYVMARDKRGRFELVHAELGSLGRGMSKAEAQTHAQATEDGRESLKQPEPVKAKTCEELAWAGPIDVPCDWAPMKKWFTACGRYFTARVESPSGGTRFTALQVVDGKQKHLIASPDGPGYVGYCRTLREAVEHCEAHLAKSQPLPVKSNREDVLDAANKAGLAVFKEAVQKTERKAKAQAEPKPANASGSPETQLSGQEGARPEAAPAPKVAKAPRAARGDNSYEGHSACSVGMAMGKAGWDFGRAKKALEKAGLKLGDGTIKTALKWGRTGEKGTPAPLTTEQLAKLEG